MSFKLLIHNTQHEQEERDSNENAWARGFDANHSISHERFACSIPVTSIHRPAPWRKCCWSFQFIFVDLFEQNYYYFFYFFFLFFWWHLKCEKWRNLIHIHESKINSLVLSTISRCTCLHRCVSVVFCWFSVFGFVFVTISFPLNTQFHASDSKPWASSFAFVDGFCVAFCLFYLPQPSINYTHKLYGYKI